MLYKWGKIGVLRNSFVAVLLDKKFFIWLNKRSKGNVAFVFDPKFQKNIKKYCFLHEKYDILGQTT